MLRLRPRSPMMRSRLCLVTLKGSMAKVRVSQRKLLLGARPLAHCGPEIVKPSTLKFVKSVPMSNVVTKSYRHKLILRAKPRLVKRQN